MENVSTFALFSPSPSVSSQPLQVLRGQKSNPAEQIGRAVSEEGEREGGRVGGKERQPQDNHLTHAHGTHTAETPSRRPPPALSASSSSSSSSASSDMSRSEGGVGGRESHQLRRQPVKRLIARCRW